MAQVFRDTTLYRRVSVFRCLEEEWMRLRVAGLVSSSLLKERKAWICGDGQIGLAWFGGEVEKPVEGCMTKEEKEEEELPDSSCVSQP